MSSFVSKWAWCRVPAAWARQLALAYLVDRLVEEGVLKDYAEVARRLGVSRARITQISNLRWLPPKVQEGILAGEVMESERTLRSIQLPH